MQKNAIVYKNTKTNLPGWVNTVHDGQAMGYAYVQDDYFIHIYGSANFCWTLSIGLTASQKKTSNDINQWASNIFGANDIQVSKNAVGEAVFGVWRPGLYCEQEIFQALSTNEYEKRSSEQALRILLEKLDDIFLYIEPSKHGLETYSHKTRELLILACTEIENTWKRYMVDASQQPINGANFSTVDYVKLNDPLFLKEYEVKLKPYKDINPIRPFVGWSPSSPTKSLIWYDAYNKTKHNRDLHFNTATLLNCIKAIAGNIVLFCVRYGPYSLSQGNSILSGIVNHLFEIRLVEPDPTTFYIPKIIFTENSWSPMLVCGDARKFVRPWITNPLVL